MLCEKCGNNAATVYIKNNINGNISESRMCQSCANINSLSGHNLSGFDLFNAVNFGQLSPDYNAERKTCKLCGANFAQLVKSGKIGCGECYQTFKSELSPTVMKMHGRAKHTGKVPKNLEAKIGLKRKLDELNIKLKNMVEMQNFEEAAVIRDEINNLSQGVQS